MAQVQNNAGKQAPNLRPFRYGTRQRVQQFGTATIGLGNQVTTELPRVGFLNGIILNVAAVVNLTGATTTAVGAPWNLLKRIRVNLNTGAASVFDCSGFGAYIVNDRFLRSSYDPTDAGMTAAPTVGAGNQVWNYSLFIPIAINNQLHFDKGLINLQAPEIRCTLDLTFGQATDLVAANFNTITGTVNMSYVYYEVPNPSTTLYPPLVMHRILEERQAITATGDQVYTFPRGGTILGLAHLVTLNGAIAIPGLNGGANSGLIDSMRLVLNKTDTIYNIPGRAKALLQAMNKGVGAQIGGVLSNTGISWEWNFLDASEAQIGAGDFRDTIDSEQISVLESILTVNSGAVIGGTAFLDSIRRIYQPLQA